MPESPCRPELARFACHSWQSFLCIQVVLRRLRRLVVREGCAVEHCAMGLYTCQIQDDGYTVSGSSVVPRMLILSGRRFHN